MKQNIFKPYDDDDFLRETKNRKIPITKRETRLLVLSLMEVKPDDIFLDIGGGSGGIALEAARLAYNGEVYCIEKDLDAYQILKQNKQRFEADNLRIIYGEAPKGLDLYNRMRFDRIFIGGSSGQIDTIIHWCDRHLKKEGKIGATFISIENCYECIQEFRKHFDHIEIINMSIAKSKVIHNLTMFKANNPVYIVVAQKKRYD